ncbi:MAG: thiamine diphosphokinase [Anaerolineales bacterium]
MSERVIIFANGSLPAPEKARAFLQEGDLLFGADGGTRHILALGLLPHAVIGDFDSLSAELLRSLAEQGISLHHYPADKDETDLELALRHALEYRPRAIRIVAALGARLDQTLGNLALLTAPWLEGIDLRLEDGTEEVFLVRKEAVLQGQVGEIVSLIPWGQPAEGVVTEGLRWALHGETLYPYRTRGISNELIQPQAHICLDRGTLLVVHRHADS